MEFCIIMKNAWRNSVLSWKAHTGILHYHEKRKMEFCITMETHIVEAYMIMKQRRVESCISTKKRIEESCIIMETHWDSALSWKRIVEVCIIITNTHNGIRHYHEKHAKWNLPLQWKRAYWNLVLSWEIHNGILHYPKKRAMESGSIMRTRMVESCIISAEWDVALSWKTQSRVNKIKYIQVNPTM